MASFIREEGPQSLAQLTRELAENIVKSQFPIDLTKQAFGLESPAPAPLPRVQPRKPAEDDIEQLVRDFARRAPVDAHALYKNGLKPSWANDEMLKAGFNGPAGDGKITWVERSVSLGGGGGTETYRYWMEEKNGKFVNGGWDPSSPSPDFLWRPQTEAAFTGKNERNPFVDPKLVKEIYEASIR